MHLSPYHSVVYSASSSSSNSSSSSPSSPVPFPPPYPPTDDTTTTTAGINDTTTRPLLERNEDFAKIEFAVLSVIFALTVAGNAVVTFILASIARHKKLSRMNVMIGHLTVADLFVGFFHVLPQLAWKVTFQFRGGQFLCKFVTYVQLVAMFAASYVLVTTAIDRYLAICHPLRMHTWGRRRMRLLVATAWIVSFIFATPQMFIFSYVQHPRAAPEDDIYDCIGSFEPEWTLSLYLTWVTLSIYLVPLVILIVLYTKICMTVWRSSSLKKDSTRDREVLESPLMPSSTVEPHHRRRRHSHRQGHSHVPRAHVRIVSQAKLKTVKLTLVIIANYVLCYGPYFVSEMWAAWDVHAPFEGHEMTIIMLLASLTSCTNPWIYVAFNDRFSVFLSSCFTHINTRPTPSTTIDSTSYTRTTHIHSTAHRCYTTTTTNNTTDTTTINATTSPGTIDAIPNTTSSTTATTTTTVDADPGCPSSDEGPEVERISRF